LLCRLKISAYLFDLKIGIIANEEKTMPMPKKAHCGVS
jgi:hypothetical protein